MSRRTRRTHSPSFKAKVALAAVRGDRVARSRVVRLMRLMGLRAIYPKRRTSSPGEGHKIYPYLLRNMKVTRPREVYAADITYIPMAKGFLYLVAVIDWHSRKALAHRLSNTMGAASNRKKSTGARTRR